MNTNKTFKIRIIETLSKTIDVEAENFEEAYRKVVDSYSQEDIVLSAEDYDETDFEWVQEENSCMHRGYRAELPLLEER